MENAKTDEKLQMFFDGELAPEEEAEVRQQLERSPQDLAQLGEWEQIRGAMQDLRGEWAGALDSDALFARIAAELGPSETSEEPVDAAEPAAPVPRTVPGGRERRIWGAVATGFAAAAAVLLAVMAWPAEPTPTGAPMARGTEVEQVDFGANAGTIFNVEGGSGQSIAVVWIVDEEVGLP
jgi:anti-sigma factor RsiW